MEIDILYNFTNFFFIVVFWFAECVDAYTQCNGEPPERIMFYRDGVGDGQFELVIESELKQIRNGLEDFYNKEGLRVAKLTYIIVTKRINSRLFTCPPKVENPVPGTVCDDVITLPTR
jgi:aubergine-like protein